MSNGEVSPVNLSVRERYQAGWGDDGHATATTMHARADGELVGADEDAVMAHVEACGACAGAEQDAREMRDAVSRMLGALEADPVPLVTTIEALRAKATLSPVRARACRVGIVFKVAGLAHVRERHLRTFLQIGAGTAFVAASAAYSISHIGFASIGHIGPTAPTHLDSAIAASLRGDGWERPGRSSTGHSPYTISGTVTFDDARHRAVRSAAVFVDGVNGVSITDANGHYVLRNLPPATRVVHVRAPGFAPVNVDVDLSGATRKTLNIAVREVLRTLGPMVTVSGGAKPTVSLRAMSCLLPVQRAGAGVPFFRALRNASGASGPLEFDIVGWPATGAVTRAKIIEEPAGTLAGSGVGGGNRIRFTMHRETNGWRGLVRERRGGAMRSEQVVLVAIGPSATCGAQRPAPR
jgi:hypothetical protein